MYHLPVLRRLVIIPFNARFSKYLEDGVTIDPKFRPYIKYELNEQSSIEYMIKIGIEGLKRIIENNTFNSLIFNECFNRVVLIFVFIQLLLNR